MSSKYHPGIDHQETPPQKRAELALGIPRKRKIKRRPLKAIGKDVWYAGGSQINGHHRAG